MPFKELEVACKIEVDSPAHLHFSKVRNFRQITVTVAPIQGYGDELVPGSGRITFPLFLRKVIQRNGADPLSSNYETTCTRRGFCSSRNHACSAQPAQVQLAGIIDRFEIASE